ncbi:Uncharacterised protein [Atlantibacter hermannii]|nr:Uncharacterised protein [Atlantibacter hermannii]
MCSFGDGNLILHDSVGLCVQVAGLLSKLNGLMEFADTLKIFVSTAKRGVISGDALKGMTGFQQIKLRFRVIGQELNQRVAEALPQCALNKCPAPLATKQ